MKDHLGNNRVLADASGNAVAVHDYDPYGEEIAVATGDLYPLPPGGTDSPYKYGGKEWNDTTLTYDFEARYLSPSFHRFTTMDPLCEKYYSISPYAYCANNPVNLVDPDGCYLIVIRDAGDETRYIVCGGKVDDDYNIYECYKNDEGAYSFRSIGLLCTPTSFYDSDTGQWAVGSIIDPNDNSGKDFLARMGDCDIFDYMDKARESHEYDFKRTNGTEGVKHRTFEETNRGMPVYESATGQIIYASARDIGNIAAGLVAGNNGLSWALSRFGCDMYQSYSTSKANGKLVWETEGVTTQNAQKEGWLRSREGTRYQMSGRLYKHHGLWKGF